MTIAPILQRELRVRSRARATYWTRFAVGLVGVLVALPGLVLGFPSFSPAAIGELAFKSLLGAGFLLACASCLLTSDMISGERREGTLGLLFLTRVRPLDILLGKLGSIGLSSLCALFALLPVLILPVLAGGVAGGEALRSAAGLVAVLVFCLAAGLWASARQTERFRAARRALGVLLLFECAPALVVLLVRFFFHWDFSAIGWLSPHSSLFAGGDVNYTNSVTPYWMSLLCTTVLSCIFLLGAAKSLRGELSEFATPPISLLARLRVAARAITSFFAGERKAAEAHVAAPDASSPSFSGTSASAPSALEEKEPLRSQPSRPLDPEDVRIFPVLGKWPPKNGPANPIAWLVERQRMHGLLWAVAILGLSHHGWVALAHGRGGFIGVQAGWFFSWPMGVASGLVGGAIASWASCRLFMETRHSRELELLLTSPLGSGRILEEQWRVLIRMFPWPVLVMQLPVLLPLFFRFTSLQAIFEPLLEIANAFVGAALLCRFSLYMGLTARGLSAAIVRVVTLVIGVPFLVRLFFLLLLAPHVSPSTPFGFSTLAGASLLPCLPALAVLAYYIALLMKADAGLSRTLAVAAPTTFFITNEAVAPFELGEAQPGSGHPLSA